MNPNPDPTLRKVSTTTTMSAPPRERRWWTSSEDEVLQNKAQVQMDRYGSVKNWNEIAALLPYRTNKDCRKRWYKVRRDIRKGAWMPEEDKKLEEAVAQVGLKWSTVARIMQTRNADQCAKRWQHVLGPDFKHAPWTPEEDKILQEAIAKYGNNWKQLGLSELPDRSTHDIRNRSVTLSRRNGRMAGNTTQKSLQAPSPSPSTPSSEADSSSSRSGSLQSSSSSCSMLLDADSDLNKTNTTIPTSNPCWSTAPSALLDPTMDSPFFTSCGWGVSPSDVLDPTHTSLSHHPQPQHPHHQSLRTDFDPWLHQLGAAAATPTSHAPHQQQQLQTSGPQTTGLQTPESEPFLLSEPGSHDPDPLDALCFLDDPMPVDDGTVGGGEMIFKTETCSSNSSDDSVDLKMLRSPYGDDSGLGSSPESMGLDGGLSAVANVVTMGGVTTTTTSTASATNGRKGSVTVLLRQSDSHLTSDVVRGLMGLDVDLTIRVVRD